MQLLSIFIFILFYGHIVFWLAGSVSPPVLATGFRSSCYGSSSEPMMRMGVFFMGNYFLGGATFRLMKSVGLSCRSNCRTSVVFVVSKTYLRALAVARTKVCR